MNHTPALSSGEVDSFSAAMANVRPGDPYDPASSYGPLAMERQLERVQGHFLKGEFSAENCWVTLDDTPRYHAALSVRGAQLQEYARAITGKMTLSLNGLRI